MGVTAPFVFRVKPMKITAEQRKFLKSVYRLMREYQELRDKSALIDQQINTEKARLEPEQISALDGVCCRIDDTLYRFGIDVGIDGSDFYFTWLDEVVLQDNRVPWE